METTTPRVPVLTLVGGLLIFAAAVAGIVTLSSYGCGASVDAVAALEPVDVVTGWFDEGILEDGKNKLVPSVTLKLRNKSGEELKSIQINALVRRVGEQEMWGEYFGWAIPRDPVLAGGAETDPLVMRSTLGYTGTQPRMQMLQNKEFIDA
ncbi:MAG: hypothetical protein AB7P34_22790, partial [Vicinamibacterales bacterium]